ncbi:hypothetical protein, partial [Desulfomarina sp.]
MTDFSNLFKKENSEKEELQELLVHLENNLPGISVIAIPDDQKTSTGRPPVLPRKSSFQKKITKYLPALKTTLCFDTGENFSEKKV